MTQANTAEPRWKNQCNTENSPVSPVWNKVITYIQLSIHRSRSRRRRWNSKASLVRNPLIKKNHLVRRLWVEDLEWIGMRSRRVAWVASMRESRASTIWSRAKPRTQTKAINTLHSAASSNRFNRPTALNPIAAPNMEIITRLLESNNNTIGHLKVWVNK